LIKAEHKTGMPISIFPAQSPWTFEQAMDNAFWPEAPAAPALGNP